MARVLGLDVGIGSVGWAVVDLPEVDGRTGEVRGGFVIVACGSRCFDVPEEPKTKELKNKKRRQFRGQRRVVRRRRQRLAAIRALLRAHGLPLPGPDPAGTAAGRVWALRAQGLERALAPEELARVLLHVAKHRGFRSNSKRDRDNKSDAGKLLRQIAETGTRLAGWRTFGEMMARDPTFEGRKRNVPDDYHLTPKRDDLEAEVRLLLERQRQLGQDAATPALEAGYRAAAFFQRPFEQGDKLVGMCRFEPGEKRCPRQSPSFERFRFLSRLNATRVHPVGERPRFLSEAERALARPLFARKGALTFKALKKAMGLPPGTVFEGLSARSGDPEAARFAAFEGSRLLAEALGETRFANLLAGEPAQLDAATAALVFLEEPERIGAALGEAGLGSEDVLSLTRDGVLAAVAGFKGVGHVSALACRKLLPHLEAGLVYSDACTAAGYDHAAIGESRIEDIRNPVVQKVLREGKKQIDAVIAAYGVPDLVHFEMARDLGKGPDERREIKEGIDKRTAERERNRARFAEAVGREPSGEELLRYELWAEQNHRCPYTGDYISPAQLVATDNGVQVDHILPYSRSGDDGYKNKVLCTAGANQRKRDRTPFEWLGGDADGWAAFKLRVEQHLTRETSRHKRRLLLSTAFEARQTDYRERHLNDTRWAMRVLRMELEREWSSLRARGEERPIRVRPGAVTAMVRKAWGLNKLKTSGELGDRDHALDAVVLACTGEALLQALTRAAQEDEAVGRGRATPRVPTPLGDDPAERERFRREVEGKIRAVFVSRPEVRRGRGPAHDATLYGLGTGPDGVEVSAARKPVWKLEAADLERLQGEPERVQPLKEALAAWLARASDLGITPAKLFEREPPRMPSRDGAGPAVRSVRLVRGPARSGLKITRGTATAYVEKLPMVRIDLFRAGPRFMAQPIFVWQVADRSRFPLPPSLEIEERPNARRVAASTAMQPTFMFSIYPGSYIQAEFADGKTIEGYYRSYDRESGRVHYAPHHDTRREAWGRFTIGKATSIKKFHVDRLVAGLFEIRREPREWHGVACS